MNLIVILGIIVFVAVIVFFYILDLKERLRASEIYGKKNYLRLMTQILMRFRRDITDSTDMIVRNYSEKDLDRIFNRIYKFFEAVDVRDRTTAIYADKTEKDNMLQAFKDLSRLYRMEVFFMDWRKFVNIWQMLSDERQTNRQDAMALIYLAEYMLTDGGAEFTNLYHARNIFKDLSTDLSGQYRALPQLTPMQLRLLIEQSKIPCPLIQVGYQISTFNPNDLRGRLERAIMYQSFKEAFFKNLENGKEISVPWICSLWEDVFVMQFTAGSYLEELNAIIPNRAVETFSEFLRNFVKGIASDKEWLIKCEEDRLKEKG